MKNIHLSRRRFVGTLGMGTIGYFKAICSLGGLFFATNQNSAFPLSPLPSSTTHKKLRILILGGTNFVGPHIVESALARGHEVTIFNRGITNPSLFPDIEKIRGDRYPNKSSGLFSLKGTRNWDVAIDTWKFAPGCVEATAKILEDRINAYFYISTIGTYQNYKNADITEEFPLRSIHKSFDEWNDNSPYPLRKIAAEQYVKQHFGNNSCIFRATTIQGFDFSSDPNNQQVYWPLRILKGGDVLAPGTGLAPIQYIDVKDIASFVIRAAEKKLNGTYNLTGPLEKLTFKGFLTKINTMLHGNANLVWVSEAFLKDNNISPFSDIPSWIPLSDPEPGFFQIENKKAIQDGLTFRDFHLTFDDLLKSFQEMDLEPSVVGGISSQNEAALLRKYRSG